MKKFKVIANYDVTAQQWDEFEIYVRFEFNRKNYYLKMEVDEETDELYIVLVGKMKNEGSLFNRYQYRPTKRDVEAVKKHLAKKFKDIITVC